ncbi:YihY/virulence factor BrkB family protein [Alteribacter keqinensis]|uniref:YihY/virulence factor BrkB family protein n=1 Tax=Alteribacter keqinensis TaxID=2483800 RepID=A0A3M7TY42_9BACI|nr:YihY/virulence factor BrkB family protein [Alteribacter keqinensis]RNA69355.1 YihY/virulence factor BrkB family protein [Alteribacter keqinensis]
MKQTISFFKELINEFQKDDVPLLAAAQAYYYLLSAVPLMVLLLSIIPYLNIQPETAISVLQSVMPDETATIFEETVVDVVSTERGGLLTIGIIGTIWTASLAVNAFIQAQNNAYNVKETRSFLKARFLSIVLTICIVFALVLALALPIFGDVIITFVSSYITLPPETEQLIRILRWVVSIIVIAVILTALYHYAPNKYKPFRHAIPGAVFATISWQLVSFGFSFYVSNFGNYTATYGSLGGVVILMLWFFITGIILVVGGEINAILHRRKAADHSLQEEKKMNLFR